MTACLLSPPHKLSSLEAIFAPRSVALIGASERAGSVGRALLENLRAFPGELYAVNPKHRMVLDFATHSSLRAIDAPIDLAVVATPASTVPGLVENCIEKGVKGLVIISAGFKEVGAEGAALEQRVLAVARRNGLRIIGPNCLGVMVPGVGLNATFAMGMALPGRVAFLSQSGALCTAILDLSLAHYVGFSAFVSAGSMLDVGWADLIQHFGEDPLTSSIVIYMESIGDAAAFTNAVRQVAGRKPIVVIKVGRTAAAAKAAASHTGAMTGSDAVLDAALRQLGVLRVDTIEELFDMAEVLGKQPLPRGPRLAIVTNAGGPGALATDALVSNGGTLADLSSEAMGQLHTALPPHWSRGNPVDVLGDADAARYGSAFRVVLEDPAVDGLLAVLTPQSMTQPEETAGALIEAAQTRSKPVLTSWMGAAAVASSRRRLNAAGLPTYDYPDEAARAFQYMWQRHQRLRLLAEASRLASEPRPSCDAARKRIQEHTAAGRALLNEQEAKEILRAVGVPVIPIQLACSEEEAVKAAEEFGFPVVAKLSSATITHKTDVGGVRLNLCNSDAVRQAWREIRACVAAADFQGVSVQPMEQRRGLELIAGICRDPDFGPVLLFGAGGTMVEVFNDHALALPPLSALLVDDWISQTKIGAALDGVRGRSPVDREGLKDVLIKLGDLALACPEIEELDINPLLATSEGVVALDARIRLRF